MKLGLSCEKVVSLYGFETGLKMIKDSGFDAVDIELCKYRREENSIFYKSEDEFISYFHNIKKICDDLELEISQTHGALVTCIPDENESAKIKWEADLELKASKILGSPYCVFHNVQYRHWENISMSDETMLSENKKFFQDFLSPLCEKYGVGFSLETHGKSMISTGAVVDFVGNANNFRKSFDSIESNYKSFCLDTGHANEAYFYGGTDVIETIKTLGKDIKTLHLHDNQGVYDSHLMPLIGANRGAIKWDEVFDTLAEVGYNGVYNWELNLRYYGNYLDKAVEFMGGFLRHFTENKGRIV